MAKKNSTPKKDNPLLVGILFLVIGIIICFFGRNNDLMLFNSIRLDGDIAFPILGILCALGGILKIVEFAKEKKK